MLPFFVAPKALTIIVAIWALVRLSSGISLPSEPCSSPFSTACFSAAVDQLSGMSENTGSTACVAIGSMLIIITAARMIESILFLVFMLLSSFVFFYLYLCIRCHPGPLHKIYTYFGKFRLLY